MRCVLQAGCGLLLAVAAAAGGTVAYAARRSYLDGRDPGGVAQTQATVTLPGGLQALEETLSAAPAVPAEAPPSGEQGPTDLEPDGVSVLEGESAHPLRPPAPPAVASTAAPAPALAGAPPPPAPQEQVVCTFLPTATATSLGSEDPCEALREDMHIVVRGLRVGGEGSVRLMLFASGDAWKSDSRYRGRQAVTQRVVPASSAQLGADGAALELSFNLSGVLAYEYAVMAHHDKNQNGKLDVNWIGYPREAMGASRGAKGGPFGGPRWSSARFAFPPQTEDEARDALELQMWYP